MVGTSFGHITHPPLSHMPQVLVSLLSLVTRLCAIVAN